MADIPKLTLPQQDVFFEQLMFPDAPIYNIGAKIKIQGSLDTSILIEAYKFLLEQHDTYRSTLLIEQANVSFSTLESYDDTLEIIDLSMSSDGDSRANELMQERFLKPFDLKNDELLHKFILIKINPTFHYLFSVYHHIITDGWGTSLMFQRLVSNYNEISENGKVISEYPFSYKAFYEDDLIYQNSESFEKDKAYWIDRFSSIPEQLFQRINGKPSSHESKRKSIHINRELYNQLESLAKEYRCTSFHFVLGLLFLYFGRKQRNKDFGIGLPVLNRGKAIFKKTVGLFMGVSILRMQLEDQDTFETLLSKIRQQLRQDYRYQRFPLGKLIQELDAFQVKDQLFNITLSYEKQNYSDHFGDTDTEVIPLTHQSERVALALYIREFDPSSDVTIDFDYNTSYFDSESITQVTDHFEHLLKTVLKDPKQNLSSYNYLKEEELHELSDTFNRTHLNIPENKTVLDLFKEQVRQMPNKVAIIDNEGSFTYQQLDELSDNVGLHIVHKLGIENNSPVALLMPRSTKFIIGILGIMKSGRPYIPLDPKFPKERLQTIVDLSQVSYMIESVETSNFLNEDHENDQIEKLFDPLDETGIKLPEVVSGDSAYIIYTSGTTGTPKGVEIGHLALINFLLSMQNQPGIEASDLLYSVTTQSFDISILEFLTPLISGASIYVAAPATLSNPMALINEIVEVNPSVIQATPSFYQLLFNAGWTGDRKVKILCGGDLLSEALAEKLLKNCSELWNMYGPTETTIWSSCKRILHSFEASNIGSPIHNTQIYILDHNLQFVPKNSIGTLYISGHGLAKGYYKNEELTQGKFIENEHLQNKRMYNTGDLAKWNNDGELIFLGREDFQVKIRGYRIELGDIESKLNELQGIKEAIVVAKKQKDQESFLVAFLIPEDQNINIEAIKTELKNQLPAYMIPGSMVILDSFPQTPNNKIDRKALSNYKVNRPAQSEHGFEELKSDLEKTLSQLFKEVLNLDIELGRSDNFFDLGGHSLNAVRLISKIDESLDVALNLKVLFDYPIISDLANYIQSNSDLSKKEDIPIAPTQDYYPVTPAQHEIWMASQQDEKSVAYNMFAAYKIHGKLDKEKLETAFLSIIEHHEILRTNFIEISGFPHQKIHLFSKISFCIDDYLNTDKNKIDDVEDFVNQPFDLEHNLLLKVALFKVENDTLLVFNTHHSIMDGWSLEILIQKVIQSYSSDQLNISSSEIQFKDFAVWEQGKKKDVNLDFWSTYLDDYVWKEILEETSVTNESGRDGASLNWKFNSDLWKGLSLIAKKKKVTVHTILATLFGVLLCKNYEHNDICIGTVNSGRSHSKLQSELGMFVKTLPLRVQLNPDQKLNALLIDKQEDLLNINKFQDIPDKHRKVIRIEALIVLQNQSFNYKDISISEELTLTEQDIKMYYSRVPLLFNFKVDESLSLEVNYDNNKFDADAITLLIMRFEKMLEQIISLKDTAILDDIDIRLEAEKAPQIDIDFNF